MLQMSEGVFVEHLADYPDMELAWLQQLYEGSTQEANTSLNNVVNSVLMPSLSGFTKKVAELPTPARHFPAVLLPRSGMKCQKVGTAVGRGTSAPQSG